MTMSGGTAVADEGGGGGGAQASRLEAEIVQNEPQQQQQQQQQQRRPPPTQQVDDDELMRLLVDEPMRLPDKNIVISGMAGRLPKCDSMNEYEEHLYEGKDMINENDDSRFECALWRMPRRFGRIKHLEHFDCEFFGLTPEEANHRDYQERLLYEVVYEAIVDAGVQPAQLRGSNTGVFFGLHTNEFEHALATQTDFKPHGYYVQFATKIAQYFDFRGLTFCADAACASAFVAFHEAVEALDKGIVDAAIVCSSNVSVHPSNSFIFLQMQMLSPTGYSRFLDERGDGYLKSEACVAVLLQRKHEALRNYASIMSTMTSADGFKREGLTFPSDKSQEHLIRETKRLAGIHTNNVEFVEAHGTGTPAGDPQEARALARVYFPRWDAAQAPLSKSSSGDDQAAESETTTSAVDQEQQQQQQYHPWRAVGMDKMRELNRQAEMEEPERVIGPLLVCSVKTNMGHSEAASGLCALAKVALQFEHELIYQGLHCEQPNKKIESVVDGRLSFVHATRKLRAKVVPVSCYGFGGANVHAVVRANERPAIDHSAPVSVGAAAAAGETSLEPRLICMFGRDDEALTVFFDNIMNTEARHTRHCLTDDFLALVDALSAGGKIDRLMSMRGYLIVDRTGAAIDDDHGGDTNRKGFRAISKARELARAIAKCELAPVIDANDNDDVGHPMHFQEARVRHVNLVYPGLGCQWPAMAAGLRDFEPFWRTVRPLQELLEPRGLDIVDALTNAHTRALDTMRGAITAIVVYQLALTNIVKRQLRVNHLARVVGHSIGEISAAHAVGLLDEREAALVALHVGATLDAHRDRIGGKMIAVSLSESQAQAHIDAITQDDHDGAAKTTLRVSCINGPHACTVSGACAHIDAYVERLARVDTEAHASVRHVPGSLATHNDAAMSEQVRAAIRQALSKVIFPGTRYARAHTNWISSVEGDDALADDEKLASAEYFARNICSRVQFARALAQLDDDSIALEMSPAAMFATTIGFLDSPRLHYVPFGGRRDAAAGEQRRTLLESLGKLYLCGGTFDLTNFYAPADGGARALFPVRRQTPSLSSLLKWRHTHAHFVPRYPHQFGRSSSKCEFPIDLLEERSKFLKDHCVEGRILQPATAYLYLAWRVFSFTRGDVFDLCFQDVENELMPVEFHNVRLHRAVILSGTSTQVYVQFEKATGHFEITEGGSLVVDGYAHPPEERPDALLYESVRERIRATKPKLELNKDDIYKRFRVNGYDYGPAFQCVERAANDGTYCQVKFNGHFVALTDSILQLISLALARYSSLDGLLLPTKFEYVRFQPRDILAKVKAAKMDFDKAFKLDTKQRRRLMAEMMHEEHVTKVPEMDADKQEKRDKAAKKEDEDDDGSVPEAGAECLFDTYCDPTIGVIITDGIEFRGIRATPAPRRVDQNEAYLESYQFARDFETPVRDELLTRFETRVEPYARICDALASHVHANLLGRAHLANSDDAKEFTQKHLHKAHECANHEALSASDSDKDKAAPPPPPSFDIKKDGQHTVASILDQLHCTSDVDEARKLVRANACFIERDMLALSAFFCERLMRPMLELAIENACHRKSNMTLLEVNWGDILMRDKLHEWTRSIEPMLLLEYSLAHPDLERLSVNKLLQREDKVGTYSLRSLKQLFVENNLKNLDCVVYTDPSCYAPTRRDNEPDELMSSLKFLATACKSGGFVLILARTQITSAEMLVRSLMSPDEPVQIEAAQANEQMRQRYARILACAQQNNMLLVSERSSPFGCNAMLFKVRDEPKPQNEAAVDQQQQQQQQERVMIRITHHNGQEIRRWLEEIKTHFDSANADTSDESEDDDDEEDDDDGDNAEPAAEEEGSTLTIKKPQKAVQKTVWLCAVATKEQPLSGIVGMMQTLKKELGTLKLRCFYDAHTFKDALEPIGVDDIARTKVFEASVQRDLLWTCVDAEGQLGCYRHVTINDYMSYADCLCDEQALEVQQQQQQQQQQQGQQSVTTTSKPVYVNNAVKGDLSSFAWYESPLEYLSAEERARVVRIAYSALNFRDIMLATGRLPLDALPAALCTRECLIGLEFAGYDARGQRVMGMVSGFALATHVHCERDLSVVVRVPEHYTLREAATIPVVYITVIMALVQRGRAKRGESILIHAASGGVGQAALHLAHHLGLQCYATVGTDEKRAFLVDEFAHCLDDARIFSSRTCDFEHEVMAATHGRGVDLVLNSLADDKLQASVRCLADGGRFLEIGKYDMAIDSRLELTRLDTNKTFHGILLDALFDTSADSKRSNFASHLKQVRQVLEDGLEQRFIKPIKHTVFKRNQIEQAFRYMATGKHIGKVLVEIDAQLDDDDYRGDARPAPLIRCQPRAQFSPDKAYLVTGGLGGFGLELVKWLARQGARYIVVTSRRGPRTGYQHWTLDNLRRVSNVECRVVLESEADATSAAGARELVRVARAHSPTQTLGGVFHLAMVLKDTLLENMSAHDFELVLRPKLDMGANLDAATRMELDAQAQRELHAFVVFSSVSCAKGNVGQANYAYANSALERLVERRRADGLAALTVQWGVIGDVGAAFENFGGNDVVIGGTRPQRMPSCFATLQRLLAAPFTTALSVLPVRSGADGLNGKTDLVGAIFHVLGIKDPSKVSEQATLGELGLDSLMAVEIRQHIEREYDQTLNIQEIRSLTVAKIREIGSNDGAKQAAAAKQQRANTAQQARQAASRPAEQQQQQQQQAKQTKQQVGVGYGKMDAERIKAAQLDRQLNEAIERAYNDHSLMPALELPRADFRLLNSGTRGRPLLFVAPISGSFELLEPLCARLERPCIGLTWSAQLASTVRDASLQRAASELLDLLDATHWPSVFRCEQTPQRVVDLVGYSFGATIAFEMMLALHRERTSSNISSACHRLEPGTLVLLDGSPWLVEEGSRLQKLAGLRAAGSGKPHNEAEVNANDIIMAFVITQVRRHNIDAFNFAKLQRKLDKYSTASDDAAAAGQNAKMNTAAATPQASLLKRARKAARMLARSLRRATTVGSADFYATRQPRELRLNITQSILAACHKHELIKKYEAPSVSSSSSSVESADGRLESPCVLLRARDDYLRAQVTQSQEETRLRELVPEHKLTLLSLAGNHESFLKRNESEIAEIIAATPRR